MARQSARKDMTLKSLELFQACAREGSFQSAANQSGLSISTVSHHMQALEEHLGAELFDHARRPMVLTPTGRAFLRKIEGALLTIRKAKAEASAGSDSHISYLRIGAIEDFDSDIIPDLAVFLSARMQRCEFSYQTNTSQMILQMLNDRELDLGITTAPMETLGDVHVSPLLKDPFIMVLPAAYEASPQDVLRRGDLPFLRFSSGLMIARQIESQLRRLGQTPPFRFESDNNQTLMAMVAAGAGWTITTPMLFARARRFHDDVRLHRFPGPSFARTLSIVTTPDCPRSVAQVIDDQLKLLITQHAINPTCRIAPWLSGKFALID